MSYLLLQGNGSSVNSCPIKKVANENIPVPPPLSDQVPAHILNSDEPFLAPDGKLRAKLTLPDIEESWEEAKRTR